MYGRVFAVAILTASLANTADINCFAFGTGVSVDAGRLAHSADLRAATEVDATDGFISESSAAITGTAVAFLHHSRPTASTVLPGSTELYRPMDLSLGGRAIPELSSAGVLLFGLLLFVVGLADRRIRKRHRSK
jgi:hypothetical protein